MTAYKASAAVMARRTASKQSLDFFPTPLWATRMFLAGLRDQVGVELKWHKCWEPACGDGAMARVLREEFADVVCSDIAEYGLEGSVRFDFLSRLGELPAGVGKCTWLVTNPPFHSAGEFVSLALERGFCNVAVLARTAFVESRGRWDSLFAAHPPRHIFQYVDRVAMVEGCLDAAAVSATSYAWFVWRGVEGYKKRTAFHWLSGRRADFEREGDWE